MLSSLVQLEGVVCKKKEKYIQRCECMYVCVYMVCVCVCVFIFHCESWQSNFKENNDVFYPWQKDIEPKLSGS